MPKRSVKQITSIEELLETGLEIKHIATTEISAKREWNNFQVIEDFVIDPSDFTLQGLFGLGEKHIDCMLAVEITTPNGTLTVAVSSRYIMDVEVDIIHEVCEQFVGTIGFMTLVPYIRQVVSDTASNVLGSRVILPLITPGQFDVEKIS